MPPEVQPGVGGRELRAGWTKMRGAPKRLGGRAPQPSLPSGLPRRRARRGARIESPPGSRRRLYAPRDRPGPAAGKFVELSEFLPPVAPARARAALAGARARAHDPPRDAARCVLHALGGRGLWCERSLGLRACGEPRPELEACGAARACGAPPRGILSCVDGLKPASPPPRARGRTGQCACARSYGPSAGARTARSSFARAGGPEASRNAGREFGRRAWKERRRERGRSRE
jgi:hypothetical protein